MSIEPVRVGSARERVEQRVADDRRLIVRVLADGEDTTPAELACLLRMSEPRVRRRLLALERDGLVERGWSVAPNGQQRWHVPVEREAYGVAETFARDS